MNLCSFKNVVNLLYRWSRYAEGEGEQICHRKKVKQSVKWCILNLAVSSLNYVKIFFLEQLTSIHLLNFRPDFAPDSSGGEESDEEFEFNRKKKQEQAQEDSASEEEEIPVDTQDRRLRRLQNRGDVGYDSDDDDRYLEWFTCIIL